MPDQTPGDSPASATAPPAQGLQSGGAGGTPQGGVLPPSASAPPTGGNIHPAGMHAVGLEMMRKVMAGMHIARSMLDPSSEEGKAADSMFQKGRRHFMADMQAAQSGQMPQMNPGSIGQGGGQPPPMRGPQAGNMLPAVGQNNLPTGPAPMRAAA